MNLPEDIRNACALLFDTLPLNEAMPNLVGSSPKHTALLEEMLRDPALENKPELAAALWLYVDNLERSHTISHGISSPTGSLWHGIMHRREGDFSNSHYWMRRAETHPLFSELDSGSLVDAVSQSNGGNPPELVERQRQEWLTLFTWCANNP